MSIKTFKDLQEERITMEDIAREQLALREKKRKSPKRLLIDVPEHFHKEIKQNALNDNISMTEWVIKAIQARIDFENEYE